MVYPNLQIPSAAWLLREAPAGRAPGRSQISTAPSRGGIQEDTSSPSDPGPPAEDGVYRGPFPTPDGPVPDPLQDAVALEELEEEITTLASHIHAATHRLLTLVAEFDRRRGWELGGHRTCAHWLAFRTGIDLGTAREKVRTARALRTLPRVGASMGRGELSFSKVRALTRVATQENEDQLLDFARSCTTAQLERMVRAVRRGSPKDEAAWEKECYENRTLSVFPSDDPGMVSVRGQLPAEMGALVMRAIEAASDALYREEGPAWMMQLVEEEESRKKAAQRRADALVLLAERALAAGFGTRKEIGRSGSDDDVDPEPADEDSGSEGSSREGCCASHAGPSVPISGTRAERYQVVLHVEAETLAHDDGEGNEEGAPVGRSELEDGTRVSAETSRRLSCDAGVVRVSHAPDGRILDVGRRTRTVPPALRRALEYRDRGCRFPGCGLRFTDAHHVEHWAEGGETKLGNLVLLCRYHHRLVHEEGWVMDWWGEGRPVFFSPLGGAYFDGRWSWPEEAVSESDGPGGSAQGASPRSHEEKLWDDPAQRLLDDNRNRGVSPDGWAASARWKREEDIPAETAFQAFEAMLPP